MKFTALPVGVGDSFLLQVENITILVDGGMNQSKIIPLLNKAKIWNKHINVVICTHYDADHINGIIGVLKSNYTFDELWLPEIFGSITYTSITKDAAIDEYMSQRNEINLDEIFQMDSSINLPQGDFGYENIDIRKLKYFPTRAFLYRLKSSFKRYRMVEDFRWDYLSDSLYHINQLVYMSIQNGAFIRWFKYQNNHFNRHIAFNLFPLNSIQTGLSVYSPLQLFRALYLTTINKESLVFLYNRESLPNVLFTADSDLSFVNKGILLVDNSIATAPHHGSEENNLAYSKIPNDNIYFVRSDRSQIKRPGSGFLSRPAEKRYCTICRNNSPKTLVTIEFTNSGIKINKNHCIC